MKFSKIAFLLMLPLLAVAFVIDYFFCHGAHTAILCGIPMIGSSDMRVAYVNAYRSLYNKATNNGKLANKLGEPGGPSWLPNTGNKILSQSDIRSEILLNVNKTRYQFGINNNDVAPGQVLYNTERRLALNDVFYVSQIGYYFRILSTTAGNTDFNSQLFTHIPGQFSGAINLNQGAALWDGNLTLSILNRVVIPEWDLTRHYEVPQTQYPVFTTPSATAQYPVNDEFYGSQSGMYPTEPMWILDGSYDNVLEVNYNNALTIAGLSTCTIHMVVVMRGILAQNCSKVMEPGTMNPM